MIGGVLHRPFIKIIYFLVVPLESFYVFGGFRQHFAESFCEVSEDLVSLSPRPHKIIWS